MLPNLRLLKVVTLRRLALLVHGMLTAIGRWLESRSPFAPHLYDVRNAQDFEGYLVHEIMLMDRLRVNAYRRAIDQLVKEGDIVIDLGTGTGLLAFFAAKKAKKVYAIEHALIVKAAEKIAEHNAIANVEFFQCNSRQFSLNKKADVLIHEQIGGNNPFSENMIQNILDLRRRVLKEGGRIIPNKFEIYLEPIELKDHYRVPFIWELEVHGLSFRVLRDSGVALPGRGGYLIPYHRRAVMPEMIKRLLCEPKPIMRFDLETLNENDLPKRVHYENTAVRDGRVDGLCIYFKALFDDESCIETAPTGKLTSWKMVMYRIEEVKIKTGQLLSYDLAIESFLKDRTWRLTWGKP